MAKPLDLSKPLNLSRKPAVSDLKSSSSHDAPVHGHPSAREHRTIESNTTERIKLMPSVPPLGSTKYPLQRGLAYVQSRQARPDRPNVGTDIRKASIERAKNTLWESASQQQDPSKKNSLAPMQQHVRDEAASNAVLQAQATQAAQATINMAMARYQAATGIPQQQSSETYFPPTVKHVHPPNGKSNIKTHQQISPSDSLAPVKRIERQLSNDDLRAYMVEEDLSRLPVRNGVHTEQDILKAYRALAHQEAHYRTHQNTSTANLAKNEIRAVARKPIAPSSQASAQPIGGSHTQCSNLQKSINGRNTLPRRDSSAATVDGRMQAYVKEQQKHIALRQSQLLEDINNNSQLLDLYASMEGRRQAFNRGSTYEQQTRVREGNVTSKNKYTREVSKLSHNPEYVTAEATCNTLGRPVQNHRNVSHNPSPSTVARLQQSNSLHDLSTHRPTDVTSKQVEPTHARNIPRAPKRPTHNFPEEVVPRKKPVVHDSRGINFSLSEAQRLAMTRQLLMNSSRQRGHKSLVSNFPGKSAPVRDRLLMARREKERQLAMLQYAQMRQKPMSIPVGQTARPELFDQGIPKDLLNSVGYYRKVDRALHHTANEVERIAQAQTYSRKDIPALNISPPRTVNSLVQKPKESEPDVIDLTEDPSPPKRLPNEKLPLNAHARSVNRLPSYDDAIAAQSYLLQRKQADEPLTSNEMTSVAKQLVSSSHEWIKRYISGQKDLPPGTQEKLLHGVVKHISDAGSNTAESSSDSNCSSKSSFPSPHALHKSKDALSVGKPSVISPSTQAHFHIPWNNGDQELPVLRTREPSSDQGKLIGSQEGRTTEHNSNAGQFTNAKAVERSGSNPPIGDLVSSVFKVRKTAKSDDVASKKSATKGPTSDQKGAAAPVEDTTGESVHVSSDNDKAGQQENDLTQADSAKLGTEEMVLQVKHCV